MAGLMASTRQARRWVTTRLGLDRTGRAADLLRSDLGSGGNGGNGVNGSDAGDDADDGAERAPRGREFTSTPGHGRDVPRLFERRRFHLGGTLVTQFAQTRQQLLLAQSFALQGMRQDLAAAH